MSHCCFSSHNRCRCLCNEPRVSHLRDRPGWPVTSSRWRGSWLSLRLSSVHRTPGGRQRMCYITTQSSVQAKLLCSPLRHEPQHALLFASSEGRKLRCLLFDTARCSCSLFLIVTCHSLLYGRSKFQRRERRKCFVKGLYDARIAHDGSGHLRIVSASLSNAVLPRFFPNSKSSFSRHARGLTMLVHTSSSI